MLSISLWPQMVPPYIVRSWGMIRAKECWRLKGVKQNEVAFN